MPIFSKARFPDEQSYFTLAGQKSPGVCRFTKPANSPRSWDVRHGYGFSGAFVVYTGTGLAKFSIAIELWEAEQFNAPWLNFAKLLAKPERSSILKSALGIVHPLISMPPWSIKTVVVEDVNQFTSDDTGLFTCTIDFLEYAPPKRALQRPSQSIPGVAKVLGNAASAADAAVSKAGSDFQASGGG